MNEIEGLLQAGATWSRHPTAELDAVVKRGMQLRRRRRVGLFVSLVAVTVGSWLVAGALSVGPQEAGRRPIDPAAERALLADTCVDNVNPKHCSDQPSEDKGPLWPDHGQVEPGAGTAELRVMRAQMADFYDCLAEAGYDFVLRNIGEKGLPIYEPADPSQFVFKGNDAKGVPLYEPTGSISEEFHSAEDRCGGHKRAAGSGRP